MLRKADTYLREELSEIFARARAADADVQSRWQVTEGSPWRWQRDGVSISDKGTEWSALGWEDWHEFESGKTRNFVIEATVVGNAEAAGLSFGPYKDFLAPLGGAETSRHLQLEIDADNGCWAFRVDGQLMNRWWWDSGVKSVEDLLTGRLTLKAKKANNVLFQNLSLQPFAASCRLSVIMTCFRFVQRLRLTLRNWCHQDLPSGTYEILVVNPESPDGTHEHIAAVARSFPHIRVREIPVGADLTTNKGAMINKAIAASKGEWIWMTDADCLFESHCAGKVLEHVVGQPHHLFFGERRHLSSAQTDALLAGRLDGMRDFSALAAATSSRAPENAPWGYTQIVHRQVLNRIRYREGINHFAHSDDIFVADCRRRGVTPKRIDGLFCLHLDHPFSWYGTEIFL